MIKLYLTFLYFIEEKTKKTTFEALNFAFFTAKPAKD